MPVLRDAVRAALRGPKGAPDVARGRAIGWSAAYPGLGHRLVGRTGEGVARGSVFTLALGAILFLVVSRAGNGLASSRSSPSTR